MGSSSLIPYHVFWNGATWVALASFPGDIPWNRTWFVLALNSSPFLITVPVATVRVTVFFVSYLFFHLTSLRVVVVYYYDVIGVKSRH